MASLYRKPIVVVDPQTGAKSKTQSDKWWGQYKDANGRLRRHPLAVDKKAAQAMLTELVRQVERQKAGLVDPTQDERERPISEHLTDFTKARRQRGVGKSQLEEVSAHLRRISKACGWRTIADITARGVQNYLGARRFPPEGSSARSISAQTYNHYVRSAKQFTRWLVRDERTPTDPLAHLPRVNVSADRRHDRRALSHDEFTRLLVAARLGPDVEGLCGEDRALLYLLAGYTGFRKGELGSLTRASFQLDGPTPTVTVAASYSKRRRRDTQLLHPDVAKALTLWLARRPELKASETLFPISERAGAPERRTSKMMQRDLKRARQDWIDEAATAVERQRRLDSDLLAFKSADGRFADFHSLRHFFITNLERAGVSPKVAQTLARHSDIRLTLGVYTHVDSEDQLAAIGALRGIEG